ncbi:MAG: hypothetical protein QNJ41_11025 [Xenococcaceae cyanobacterium MO_188.B32]|nr:hypothetical protein [Xenococcaceae cyanobacterium MO_188.B32]
MFSLSSLPLQNVSLVTACHYKPPCLTGLIDYLQTYFARTSILKKKFLSYRRERVHSRSLGYEEIRTEQATISK